MVRILLCFLCSDKCCCSRTMVSVGNIKIGHTIKFSCNGGNISIITDHPELMMKAVNGCYEVIFGLGLRVTAKQFVEHFIVRIGQKDRFHVGIAGTNMLHSVFFFLATSQFMLLDYTRHIV